MSTHEYGYDFNPAIPRGRVVFEIRNIGAEEHELLISPLPEDFPPIDEQLRGSERRAVQTLARVLSHPPDSRATTAVDLKPGRYAMMCFVRLPDGTPHAQKGMSAEFRVR